MQTMIITGGCGFIGVHAAKYFMGDGWSVTVLDNLSRRGAQKNLDWLKSCGQIEFVKADVRDRETIEKIFQQKRVDVVLHLAGQVAVTTSIKNPREDFEVNAQGTFNILEAVRQHQQGALMINASTNKVYGKMEDIAIHEDSGRYAYKHYSGIDESRQLDFYSPYGCSKGTADQYVLDYARIYNLKTVSMRQSCIYGPRQFGIEDQGWVAWFSIAACFDRLITIYGDGKQVRDALHVQDLVRVYKLAIENQHRVAGQAFNVGGGVQNTLSLLELIAILEKKLGKKLQLRFADWRSGDQSIFVCCLDKVQRCLGWKPEIGIKEGVGGLIDWVKENKELLVSEKIV